MDLRSADSYGSWHPLTSLINLVNPECAEEGGGEAYLFPTQSESNRHLYSTLLHEITHQWGVRTTRLGYYLSRIAAEQAVIWEGDRAAPLHLGPAASRAVSAFLPLLEGMALYAQLDFEPPEGDLDGITPNALTLVAHTFDPHLTLGGHSFRDIFRLVRGYVLKQEGYRWCSAGEDPPGLPDLLFLDSATPSLGFYLVGYLYIKAVQAHWSRSCKEMEDPSLFLPVVLRAICDHPVIEELVRGELPEGVIIDRVHAQLESVAASKLRAIARLLIEREDWREMFDYWDADLGAEEGRLGQIPTQRARLAIAERFFPPSGADQDPELEEDPAMRWMSRFRAAAGVYLFNWYSGALGDVDDESVMLRDGDGKEQRISFLFWGGFVDGTVAIGSPEPVEVPVAHLIQRQEWAFRQALRDARGRRATIASFFTLSLGVAGSALWIDGALSRVVCYSRNAFASDSERQAIGEGLAMSPEDRIAFANAFVDGRDLKARALGESRRLLATLVSDPAMRARLSRDRFGPFLRPTGQQGEFLRWCGFSLFPASPPPGAVAALDAVFDFPGFRPADGRPIAASDLLPPLTPYIQQPPRGDQA